MLTAMDYIAGAVFLLSAAVLARVAYRAVRWPRRGQKVATLVEHPLDMEAMRRRMAVVYTSAAFTSYGEAEAEARPLSKREALLQKLNEALPPGAPSEIGALPGSAEGDGDADAGDSGANDYPDDDDVDSAAMGVAPPAEGEDGGGEAESSEAAGYDPAANFFSNREWEATR
jgi:hypothetical protein